MSEQTCYLQEDDPPEDHDIDRFSCVCGKCYEALANLEEAAQGKLRDIRRAIGPSYGDVDEPIVDEVRRLATDNIAACESLCEAEDIIETLISALRAADRDIGEWCQLGQRQYDELPNKGFNPLAPTPAGIAASRRVQQEIIGGAIRAARQVKPRSEANG
jgi:hypothetical protein